MTLTLKLVSSFQQGFAELNVFFSQLIVPRQNGPHVVSMVSRKGR